MKVNIPFFKFIPIDFQYESCQHCSKRYLRVSRLKFAPQLSYIEFRKLPVCVHCLNNDELYTTVKED